MVLTRRMAAAVKDAAADSSATDAAFDAARGWCWPVRDIHLLPPPSRRAEPLPFWRLIGPETRCALAWRAELAAGYRVYALSSLTFALVGAIGLAGARLSALEAGLLACVALTSFQVGLVPKKTINFCNDQLVLLSLPLLSTNPSRLRRSRRT